MRTLKWKNKKISFDLETFPLSGPYSIEEIHSIKYCDMVNGIHLEMVLDDNGDLFYEASIPDIKVWSDSVEDWIILNSGAAWGNPQLALDELYKNYKKTVIDLNFED